MLHFNINTYFPRWLLWSIKALIAVVAIRFILQKVFSNESLDELSEALHSLSGNKSLMIMLLVLVLIPINLMIETWKWKLAMLPLEKISFINSFAAVLTGIAVSFFTPNRAGEFAGRILYVNNSDKIKASLITILAGMSQLVITISIGSICLLFYLRKLISSSFVFYPLCSLVILLSAGLILLFIYFPLVSVRFSSLRIFKRLSNYLSVFNLYRPKILLSVLILSMLRFIVFVHQYYFLMLIFFPETPYLVSMQMISIIYLVLSVIPTFAISEIGVRSSVALYYLGTVINSPIAIALATLSIWLINLVIPSLAGSVIFLSLKLENENNNRK